MERLSTQEKFEAITKDAVRDFRAGEISEDQVADYKGYEVQVMPENGHYLVNVGELTFKVTGDKRLRSKQVADNSSPVEEKVDKPKKAKKTKEVLPDRITKVCSITGEQFETSKFTQYVNVSPAGRKIKRLSDKHGVSTERIVEIERQLRDDYPEQHIAVYDKDEDAVVMFTNSSADASAQVVQDTGRFVWIQQHI